MPRCDSRTTYRDGRATYRVRCDLDEGHSGRHELRSRSTDELVTRWTDSEGTD